MDPKPSEAATEEGGDFSEGSRCPPATNGCCSCLTASSVHTAARAANPSLWTRKQSMEFVSVANRPGKDNKGYTSDCVHSAGPCQCSLVKAGTAWECCSRVHQGYKCHSVGFGCLPTRMQAVHCFFCCFCLCLGGSASMPCFFSQSAATRSVTKEKQEIWCPSSWPAQGSLSASWYTHIPPLSAETSAQ